MSAPIPFTCSAYTLPLTVTTAASTSVNLPGIGSTLRVVNAGTGLAYISVGVGTQTALLLPTATPNNASTPVLAGSDISLTIPTVQCQVSAIGAAATTLLFQTGDGI